MKKIISIVLMLSLLLTSLLLLNSCEIINGILSSDKDGDASDASLPKLSGKYVRTWDSSSPELTFSGSDVLIKMGRREMVGTYEIRKVSEGSYEIEFDFGNSTTPIGGIGTGRYPITVGTQKGIEYLLLFGTRYDKK